MDLSHIKLVDNHCHAFLPEKESAAFDQLFNLSMLDIPKLHTEHMLLYRRVITELARYLGCADNFEEVIAARKEVYARDRQAYVRKMLDEAGIETLIVDVGFPAMEFSGYTVPLDSFKTLTGRNIASIFRFEPLMSELFLKDQSFDEMEAQFLEGLDKAVTAEGHIAYKSAAAYVFGLRIDRVARAEAEKMYYELVKEGELGTSMIKISGEPRKKSGVLRHYLTWQGAKKAIEHDVPLQIHTGIGDSPFIDVRDANPFHLLEMIKADDLKGLKLVIVHSGYPYVREAAYFANNFPDVYVDLSELIPFVGSGIKQSLLNIFDTAPLTKIMYGSDGYNVPELFWISAILGRRALGEALEELIRLGFMTEASAQEAGRLILADNARRLYKL